MIKIKTGTEFEKATVETTSEFDVKQSIRERLVKVLQEEVNKCSKEYYRTIKATLEVFAE